MTDPNSFALEDVVTQEELAQFLGVTPRSLAVQRGIPHVMIGKVRLYYKQDVSDWLRSRVQGRRG